jgi:hypothetical protein
MPSIRSARLSVACGVSAFLQNLPSGEGIGDFRKQPARATGLAVTQELSSCSVAKTERFPCPAKHRETQMPLITPLPRWLAMSLPTTQDPLLTFFRPLTTHLQVLQGKFPALYGCFGAAIRKNRDCTQGRDYLSRTLSVDSLTQWFGPWDSLLKSKLIS